MRNLTLTSPYMHGQDIKDLQGRLNHVAERLLQHRLTDIGIDGQYGPETDNRTKQTLYLLGVGGGEPKDPIKSWMQTLILHPGLRSPAQRVRSSQRVKSFLANPNRKQATLNWCAAQVGTTEWPPGSNRGSKVSVWERDFGMNGEPWCGAFVGYALRHAGGVQVGGGMMYTPNIINYGRSRTGGFSGFYSYNDRQPGDLLLFKWPGVSNDPCDHVGILDNDKATTIEGNTSSGNSGSQNNGGGVYKRQRGGQYVVGCARPRY